MKIRKIIFILLTIPIYASGQIEYYKVRNNRFDLGNFLSSSAGAKIIKQSQTGIDNKACTNLIDNTQNVNGVWKVKNQNFMGSNAFPHWFVIELPKPAFLTTMAINTGKVSEKKQSGITAKSISIEISNTSPSSGFKQVSFQRLKKYKDNQVFSLEADSARWIKVSILDNWGCNNFTEIGRFYGYNDTKVELLEEALLKNKKVDVHDIHFKSNSALLESNSLPVVEMMVDILLRNKSFKILVEGHTDSDGKPSSNLDLSKDRAESVMNYLVKLGISKSRLSSAGYGESQPIASNSSEAGKAVNRRVTFKVIN